MIQESPDDFKKPIISQVPSEHHSLCQVHMEFRNYSYLCIKRLWRKVVMGWGALPPQWVVEAVPPALRRIMGCASAGRLLEPHTRQFAHGETKTHK